MLAKFRRSAAGFDRRPGLAAEAPRDGRSVAGRPASRSGRDRKARSTRTRARADSIDRRRALPRSSRTSTSPWTSQSTPPRASSRLATTTTTRSSRIDADGRRSVRSSRAGLLGRPGAGLAAPIDHPRASRSTHDGRALGRGMALAGDPARHDEAALVVAGSVAGTTRATGDRSPTHVRLPVVHRLRPGTAVGSSPTSTTSASATWIRRASLHAFAGTGAQGYRRRRRPGRRRRNSPIRTTQQVCRRGGCASRPTRRRSTSPTPRTTSFAPSSLATGIISTFGNGDRVRGRRSRGTGLELDSPVDVDCDKDGNVYVCDRGSSRVRRVDPATGASVVVAGVAGQRATRRRRVATPRASGSRRASMWIASAGGSTWRTRATT